MSLNKSYHQASEYAKRGQLAEDIIEPLHETRHIVRGEINPGWDRRWDRIKIGKRSPQRRVTSVAFLKSRQNLHDFRIVNTDQFRPENTGSGTLDTEKLIPKMQLVGTESLVNSRLEHAYNVGLGNDANRASESRELGVVVAFRVNNFACFVPANPERQAKRN